MKLRDRIYRTFRGEDSIWSKGFVVLLIISVFSIFSGVGMRSTIGKYALDLGMTEVLVGIIVGALSIASLLTRPLSGSVVDRFDHKKIMLACLFGAVVTTPLYLVTTAFVPMLLLRIASGFLMGISSTVNITLVGNILPPQKLGAGIGIYGLGLTLSLAVSPTVTVWIYDYWGAGLLFLLCTVSSAVAFGLAFLLPGGGAGKRTAGASAAGEEKERKSKGIGTLFAREALLPAVLILLSEGAYASIAAFLIVYGDVRGFQDISLFYMLYSACILFFRPLNGKMYDKYGLRPIVYSCAPAFAVGLIMIAFAPNMLVIMIASVFCAYGWGGSLPALQAAALSSVGPARRGAASSTFFIGDDLGNAAGAAVAGMLASAFGYTAMYVLAIIPLALCVLIFALWTGRVRNKKAAEQRIPAAVSRTQDV